MSKKRAFITGIAGQDGSYLADLLLEKGYEVHGLVRYSTTRESLHNIRHIEGKLQIVEGDLTDQSQIAHLIKTIRPHEIYNLAAQSHVGKSFEIPQYTAEVTAIGVLNLLEAVRASNFNSKVYQASTSELFGNAEHSPQSEATPFIPRSPYAVSKLFAHHMVRTYREAYNMFACSGILFNHESPRRGGQFVTRKVCQAAVDIAEGRKAFVELGNLDARRDWGHAKDYVRGMYLMMQQAEPRDYVLATGTTRSVRDLVNVAFAHVGIEPTSDNVRINPKFFRPAEVNVLVGDASLAEEHLGWEPEISFDEMIAEMIESCRSDK